MISTWKEGLDRCLREVKTLTEQMEKAGVSSKGDYRNRIASCENDIKYYEKKIKEYQAAQSPDQVHWITYVVTITKPFLHEINIDEELRQFIPQDRYGDKLEVWKPFCNSENIGSILDKIKGEGYRFTVDYLQELTPEKIAEIDDRLDTCIAIIDVLCLKGVKKDTAKRFDTKRIGNILVPICDNLASDIREKMKEVRNQVFSNANYKRKDGVCNFYNPVSELEDFNQSLHRFFDSIKIKNHILNTKPVTAPTL